MTLFEKIRKGIIDGFHAASDITSEYTKIGRTKIDILGVKKEIEEKMLELGGRVYDVMTRAGSNLNLENEEKINDLIKEIKNLEIELKKYEEKLEQIRNLEDTGFVEKKD